MLMACRTWVTHHFQAARSSFHFLCQRPVATAMTVAVISLALTLPALFWVFTDNLAQIAKHWQRGGQITLYLDMQQSKEEQKALLARVRAVEGVGQAELKTPAEGLAELQQQTGMDDMILQLPNNPLPPVIEVIPSININSSVKIEGLYLRLKVLGGVEEAKLDLQWVNRLHALLDFVKKLTHGLMLLLAATVVFIIGNTLRLAVQNRHEEIQVLKLIGATDAYIARPFLYTGFWYGVGAAFIAAILVYGFMFSLGFVFAKLVAVYQIQYFITGLSLRQGILLFISAVFLGWLGARLSIKQQLTSIEPYN